MRLPAYLLAAVCLLAAQNAHAVDTGVVGTWRGPENSVISIELCGGALCARVLSTGDETAARNDTNNPNVTLRTRPLCGLRIGEGFRSGADQNRADGGHLYDPRSGKTYKGSMVSQGDVLLLRGYIGVSMFGRTARWERVTRPVEVCRNAAPTGGTTPPSNGVPSASPAQASPPSTEPPAAAPTGAPSANPSTPNP